MGANIKSLKDVISASKKAIEEQQKKMLLKKFRIANGCGIPMGVDRYEIFTMRGEKYIRFQDTYSVSHRTLSHTWQTAEAPLTEFMKNYSENGTGWIDALKEAFPSYYDTCSLREFENNVGRAMDEGAKYLPLDTVNNETDAGVYIYSF